MSPGKEYVYIFISMWHSSPLPPPLPPTANAYFMNNYLIYIERDIIHRADRVCHHNKLKVKTS